MNQILDYNLNNRPNKSGGSDTILRVFAFILVIFAIVLIIVVGYGRFANKKQANDAVEQVTYAKISVEVDGTQAIIEVTHDKNIQKLIYSWNTGKERPIKCSGKFVQEPIDVPAGDNTLHIKVIDENGIETTADEAISSEEGVDIINPVIDLSVTEDKKLKITATDETAMDYITYRWNQDDEEKIYANENSKEISTEIEILRGKNDLTVIAVDASSNTTTEIRNFNGLTKPEIKVTLSADGSSIDIQAYHEKGIKSVAFNFNNVDYNVDIGNENPTNIQFAQKLEVGYNRIIVTVDSIDDTQSKFDGECTYGGEQESSSDTDTEGEENT